MKRFFYFFFSFSLFFNTILFAQSITWQRAYFDPPNNISRGMDVCEADNDNFYIAGSTAGSYPIYNLLYLIKINKFGDTLWTRKVNPPGNERSIIASAIASSGDGGCVITGDMNPAFTIYFDSSGNLIWFKLYGGVDVQCYNIMRTSDSGYIACGRCNRHDGYILRVDRNGNLLWQTIQYNMGVRSYNSVINAIDGGFLLAGVYQINGSAPAYSLIVKIDTLGNLIWEKTFQFNNLSSGLSSICKSNNKYYSSGGNSGDSVFFTKLDLYGNVICTNGLQSDYTEFSITLINYGLNKFILTSLKLDSTFIRIIDTTGYIYREKAYTWTQWAIPESMIKIQNGDLLLVGSVNNYPKGVYALRTDSMLNAKLPIGINPIIIKTPIKFSLKQNYPNPFNGQTFIEFDLQTKIKIKIKIFDLLGREIETIINGVYDSGVYKIDFNAEKLASGIYFYSLETENDNISKKFVLIK
jgi:hypothetical protein